MTLMKNTIQIQKDNNGSFDNGLTVIKTVFKSEKTKILS